jgi:hypothetical protein
VKLSVGQVYSFGLYKYSGLGSEFSAVDPSRGLQEHQLFGKWGYGDE